LIIYQLRLEKHVVFTIHRWYSWRNNFRNS
jgi:hypothetical protein